MALQFPGLTPQPGTNPVLEVQKSPPLWLGCQGVLNELVTRPGTWVFWIYTVPSTGAEASIHTLGITPSNPSSGHYRLSLLLTPSGCNVGIASLGGLGFAGLSTVPENLRPL